MTARVLLLGGFDPSGGAGVTADATVVSMHGLQPLPVALALTAQNRHGFRACYAVPEEQWLAMFAAAIGEGPVHSIKTGLLGSARAIELLARHLRPFVGQVPIVVDPVLSATAGGYAAAAEVLAAYREHLLPLASLCVPNEPELHALAAGDVGALLALGCGAVLHKGGHGDGALAIDTLHTARERHCFERPRLATGPVHGTGCALASAIAAHLANGQPLPSACRDAGDWLANLLAELARTPGDGLPRSLPFASPCRQTSTR